MALDQRPDRLPVRDEEASAHSTFPAVLARLERRLGMDARTL